MPVMAMAQRLKKGHPTSIISTAWEIAVMASLDVITSSSQPGRSSGIDDKSSRV
jgi:hypothetical protein